VLDAGARIVRQEARRQRALALRGVERDAQRAVGGLDHLLRTMPPGSMTSSCGVLVTSRQCAVEQEPGQHFFVLHRLGDVVDRGEASAAVAGRAFRRHEIDVPQARQIARRIDEIEQAAAEPAALLGISSSPGPTGWRNDVSRSLAARSSVSLAFATLRQTAQTEGPCVSW